MWRAGGATEGRGPRPAGTVSPEALEIDRVRQSATGKPQGRSQRAPLRWQGWGNRVQSSAIPAGVSPRGCRGEAGLCIASQVYTSPSSGNHSCPQT